MENYGQFYRHTEMSTICNDLSIHYSILMNLQHKISCSKLVISVTEHLVEVVDKLSTTAVVFFRSERILKCKCLYGV